MSVLTPEHRRIAERLRRLVLDARGPQFTLVSRRLAVLKDRAVWLLLALLGSALLFAACAQGTPARTRSPDTAKSAQSGTPTRFPLVQTQSPATSKDAPPTPELTVTFFDVGEEGDGFLVSTRAGNHMLVDGGRQSSGIAARLRTLGVKRLDVVVGTNPDQDHIGGLIEVLQTIPVGEVWDSGALNTTVTFQDYQDAIEQSDAELIEVRRGETRSLGSLPVQVIHPSDTAFTGSNNNSVVLRMQVGQVSFLFTGDAEEPAETDMIASGLGLKSTILKLGHHGSKTSTSPEFLAAVQPEITVYQAGANNQFGHPHPETLARLDRAGVKVFGTGKNGRVTITTDGKTYKVETER